MTLKDVARERSWDLLRFEAIHLRNERAGIVLLCVGLSALTVALIVATVNMPGDVTVGMLMVASLMMSLPIMYVAAAKWNDDSPETARRMARAADTNRKVDEVTLKEDEERRDREERSREVEEHLRQSAIVAEQRDREDAARMERERVDREEREKREAEEAKMRAMFKKFMAEEMGKNIDDVESMFATWKERDVKDKI